MSRFRARQMAGRRSLRHIPAVVTPPAGDGGVQVMKARFQGVTLNAVGGDDFRTLSGVDGATGFDWASPVFGARPRIQHLGNVASSIVSTTDHNGATSDVLQLTLNAGNAADQVLLLIEPTDPPSEFLVRGWLKLPANLLSLLGVGGYLSCGIEWKSAGDFRMLYQIEVPGTGPHWVGQWDNNANGDIFGGTNFPPDGVQQKSKGPLYNDAIAVPQGVWFKYEYYTLRDNVNGRTWFKVNDQMVLDMVGDTIGVNSAAINRIFLGNAYANQGSVTVLVDDIEVIDYSAGGDPGGGGGTGGNTTPMTLYLNAGANSALSSFRNLGATNVQTAEQVSGDPGAGSPDVLLTDGTLAAQFVTGRAPAGGFTLPAGSVSFAWTGDDPSAAGNRFRAKLFKRTSGGTETLIGTWDDDANLGAWGAYSWSGSIASEVTFAEDDRLLLRCYAIGAGGGNAPGGWIDLAVGDADGGNPSTITIPTTVAFKAD